MSRFQSLSDPANDVRQKRKVKKNAAHDSNIVAPSFSSPYKPLPVQGEGALFELYPLDRIIHSSVGTMTGGISPISLGLAFYDWMLHLGLHPVKRTELSVEMAQNALLLFSYIGRNINAATDNTPVITPKPTDRRFKDSAWGTWPSNVYQQSFLMTQNWWDKATQNIHGVSQHHEDIMNFTARQILDIYSPTNFPWTNPEVIKETKAQNGFNFVEGFQNFAEDLGKLLTDTPLKNTGDFEVGKNLAVTEGEVIYRNALIELIQYKAKTETVYAEPVLIIPAWIMKYYILDLSPHNSLVKYLVEQGHTVFMISWKNPTSKDRNLGFDEYINSGIMDALKVIEARFADQKIHAAGYCLGGTLLSMAAAWMAKQKKDILKSITLFAAQTDFEEGGELMLFMDDAQLAHLEDTMWQRGYLDGSQMAGAFNMLRSNDLIWSRMIQDYMLGRRRSPNDLMAWNADTTRLPYKMHTQYLRDLYLNNALAEGHFKVNNDTISLTDIRTPIFSVGTARDHVAPWQSVYKIHLLSDTDVTFVLTSGGHNAGMISEPGHKGRSYQTSHYSKQDTYIDPFVWVKNTPSQTGSWWPEWQKWIAGHSAKAMVEAPSIENSLGSAPETYVMQP